jgi:hypothetical protein
MLWVGFGSSSFGFSGSGSAYPSAFQRQSRALLWLLVLWPVFAGSMLAKTGHLENLSCADIELGKPREDEMGKRYFLMGDRRLD